jgi:RecB family exonuclease
VISPRQTRLVRVADLHAFRHSIATLCQRSPHAVVVVPTSGAVLQLRRTLHTAGVLASVDQVASPVESAGPQVVTREELYSLMHARLPNAPRRLAPLERESIGQAAAHAAASSFVSAEADPEAGSLPFRLRPGLVVEMIRFYDQLRRQSQRLERFHELIEETLGGATGDRGTDRLLAQTRFLSETFRQYEARACASGGCDEHMLRERLMREPLSPPLTHIVVTLADWIAEPDGLLVADFDLFARMPRLEQLDLVCTEQVLGSGFHERLHSWWPGLEEVEGGAADGVAPRPLLETPDDDPGRLWFTVRDREEELVAVAQHVKASRRSQDADGEKELVPLDRIAVVFKQPLPYLYLAPGTLGAAGIPCQTFDALPLAGEPFVAVIDLVLDALETGFSRAALIALLNTPHLTISDPAPAALSIRALDLSLREAGYLGELSRLETFAESAAAELRPAVDAALVIARLLAPMLEKAPASTQIGRLRTFVFERLRPLAEEDPFSARERWGRAAVQEILIAAATAHATHFDPSWSVADLAAAVRRWLGDHTFDPQRRGRGVSLLDDRAARYGDFDDLTVVGLIESEWPERQARNIFYPSGLLKALGWPSESTRRRAADARFIDLLRSPARRIAVSTVMLDDEAIVMRSVQLDEIARARLISTPLESAAAARLTADAALRSDPVTLDPLAPNTRGWAEQRIGRTPQDDPAYHGAIAAVANRPWSVSAIEVYLGCPFKFFAQHVLRLTEEQEDADVMDPRQQGQFLHRVFEVFFESWRRAGHATITPALLPAARQVFAEVVERELTRLPEAEAGLERTRMLGSPAAAGLGEAVMRMEAERPERVVERLLEHRLDGTVSITTSSGPREIALRGKADRVDLLENGTFRLVDYKLGWPPQRSRALQLPIYGLSAEQRLAGRHGRTWTLGEAAYVAFKGPRRVVPLFSNATDRAKVLGDAQQRLADAVDAIGRGEFPPTPDDVYRCETCSFAAVCRKDYVGDV